jgi:hypothetical protein
VQDVVRAVQGDDVQRGAEQEEAQDAHQEVNGADAGVDPRAGTCAPSSPPS